MKRWTALLLAAVILFLCACTGGGQKTASGTTWVTFTEVEERVKNEENKDIFVYSYQQPVVSGTSDAIHMINTKLNNSTSAFVYGSGGVEEMTELAKMDWKEVWFTCYALNRKVSVARVDDAVVSFRYSDYVFNGGMHGYTAEFGMTYDMTSGEQMSLASLTSNEWGLKEVCRQHISAYLASEEFPHKDGLLDDYEQYLDSVLKNWVLTEEGLQFIAQPYIISAYALGTLRFTVPYSKVAHILDKKWLPEEKGHGGGTIELLAIGAESPAAKNFVFDPAGESLLLKANGTIYDFSLEQVNSYKQNGKTVFYIVKQLLYSPRIASESIGLQVNVPEGIPSTLLWYRDGSGNEYQYLIGYNGRDGGVSLVEPDNYISRN